MINTIYLNKNDLTRKILVYTGIVILRQRITLMKNKKIEKNKSTAKQKLPDQIYLA